jgi:iron complex outermembrane receptor protein
MRDRIRLTALYSTALTMLVIAGGAYAQQAQPRGTANAGAGMKSGQLQEVVVTAQHRKESVQKASLQVNVLSRQQLESVTSPSALTAVMPGIQIGQAGNFDSAYIRGVGTNVTNGRAVSPIATNIDGVVVTQGAASAPFYFDLARIEVVLGPQGTLYGRNATGGAVNVITNAPVFGKYGAEGSVEFGDYALVHLTGAVNIPLADNLAVRGAFQVNQHRGYVNDGSNDDNTDAGRVRARWQPNEDISLNLTGEYGHVGGHGDGMVLKPSPNGNPWTSTAGVIIVHPPYYPGANPGGQFSKERFVDNGVWNLRGELNWNLDFATLTVIPAYSDQKFIELADSSNFRYYDNERNRQITTEARLAHENDALKWVLGGYYYNFNQYMLQALQQCQDPSCNSAQAYDQTNESEAGFGQTTVSLTQGLRVIGGARYTHEIITGAISPFVEGNPPLVPVSATLKLAANAPVSYDSFNWKVGLEYDVAPNSMAYFTASTGFKAGGVESITTGVQAYQPEKLTAYELGIKNQLFDNKLRLNADVFDWEYNNQQFGRLTLDPSGNPDFLTANAGAATIKGVDVDATWRVTDADQIHVSAEYARGVYDNFKLPVTSFGVPPLAAAACSTTKVNPINYIVDCSGKTMPRLPTWSGSVGYLHHFELSNGADVTFNGEMQYATARWMSIDYNPAELAAGYVTGNASLTYTPPDARWSVGVWVRNIANAAIYTRGQSLSANLVSASIDPPRTFGVRLSATY